MNLLMDRRKFLQTSALAAIATATIGLETGCSQETIASYVKAIGTAVENLAKTLAPGYAAQVNAAWTAAYNDIEAWTPGTASSGVVQVLNDLEGVIAMIPIPAPYAPIIDIAIAGLEGILSINPDASAKQPSFASAHANVVNPAILARAKARVTPIPIPTPTTKDVDAAYKSFRNQWNLAIATHPELKATKVK